MRRFACCLAITPTFVGCGDKAALPRDRSEVAPVASSVNADALLAEVRARVPAAMGVDALEVWGVDADGVMDAEHGSVTVHFRRPVRTEAEDPSSVCVQHVWSLAAGWAERAEPGCAARDPYHLGFAHLGLPRCKVTTIWARARESGRVDARLGVIEYRVGLPYESPQGLQPGEGTWSFAPMAANPSRPVVAVWHGPDECAAVDVAP